MKEHVSMVEQNRFTTDEAGVGGVAGLIALISDRENAITA
jgi:hypothetical protein